MSTLHVSASMSVRVEEGSVADGAKSNREEEEEEAKNTVSEMYLIFRC